MPFTLEQIKRKQVGKNQSLSLDDIRSRALQRAPAPPQRAGIGGAKGFSVGVAKGELSTLAGMQSIGQSILSPVAKGINRLTGGDIDVRKDTGFKFLKDTEKFKPQGTAEKVGFGVERIAEFAAPSSKLAAISKGRNLLHRAAIEATAIGGQTAVQEGGYNDEVKTAAIIGALFPVGGAALKTGKQLFGKGLSATGRKIGQSVIRPNARDLKDGFKMSNVYKYNLGGSLKQTLTKTNTTMNSLGKELHEVVNAVPAEINLAEVFKRTAKKMTANKARSFGENKGITRVLKALEEEIVEVSGDVGRVNFAVAQDVKRGAGTKGSWVFGNADPDANAIEKVYTTFYGNMRKEMESVAKSTGNSRMMEINKSLSDLIPISNATIRRIPVAERNRALSLTDVITLGGSFLNPSMLGLFVANRMGKSGVAANVLAKTGGALERGRMPFESTAVGQRAFGGNLKDLKNVEAGLSMKSIAKKIHRQDLDEMRDVTDYVMGAYKPKDPMQLELSAARIAERYGITGAKTIKGLASKFASILDQAGMDRQLSRSNFGRK